MPPVYQIAVRPGGYRYTGCMTAPVSTQSIVSIDPEVMSGAPVFRGTRVPIKTLFEYLAAGDALEEFYEDFPGVTESMVCEALDEAQIALIERHVARPA